METDIILLLLSASMKQILLLKLLSKTHLEVQLYGVHPEDLVSDVTEHVAGTDHPHPGGELHQLLDLGAPLALVTQVTVGPELDRPPARLPRVWVILLLDLRKGNSCTLR